MPLNLISDPWLPVLDRDGARRVIAPWQMADADLVRPDWPRADLNLGCLEFLIGLVFLADPPADAEDWDARVAPDPQRLRARLAPFAPAFDLTGDGPRFLQDLEALEGEANPPDLLFIDSAGANTSRNSADLMVRRERYPALDLPLAAMALYTFQAHAPAGGAGNRTSMRGGGPLVTLVDPGDGLWGLVWANVPDGRPGALTDLPWMRQTRLSEAGQATFPPQGQTFGVEALFGMPRRLRLVETGARISSVIQRPYGTNYAAWKHPLTPHYRVKEGAEWLPRHPRPGVFGYRHWLGVLAEAQDALSERALCLTNWQQRAQGGRVLVGGWSMDNMKPRDFILASEPVVALEADAALMLNGMIRAAEAVALALRNALEPVLAAGEAREVEREAFFRDTEAGFLDRFEALKAGTAPEAVAEGWLRVLNDQALAQFDALCRDGLAERDGDVIQRIVRARGALAMALMGFGKRGGEIFDALGMTRPAGRKGRAA